ncbi:fluoride efflux transporter CrcB [Periweissella beninensis]|uniref:Fluoride-specific ion channel FluC n=1 Tax=Periweissella beninensis TaxID=504936 RepID=A0ABT0VL41_9LACO|nr:fluoride efflux transporter CrcB [Periweissella beninensis]MBM7543908.1 CrcB protein [Periweissella beninensis]MCM2437634.1 fluoride efflux transporter CrcB [Periweissella beninensis]MCT4396172.1 fluoride efflux transporter CrcB [Periweissella beninensis]
MILMIGLGAAVGSIIRYVLTQIVKQKQKTVFPLATFVINLSGSFLLGMLLGLNSTPVVYKIFGTGLIGGYTTFSTFNTEIILLKNSDQPKMAMAYLLSSYLGGGLLAIIGWQLGKLLG